MKQAPAFRKTMASIANGEVVIPIIRAKLWNPDFDSFTIEVEGFKNRPWDGWFHPSTHPTWPERMLYYYLTEHERLVAEPFDTASVMAITQGNFWHTFVQKVLIDAGYLIPPPEGQKEHGFSDTETRSRGSVDGLSVDSEVFEYKTMMTAKMARIERGAPTDPAVLESFKRLAPEYFFQGQEYMRLSGFRRWRGVIQGLEYPFEMREIAMEFDPAAAYGIRDKYRAVLQAVADQRLPLACCAPKSDLAKVCPARLVCPVGSM